MRFIAFSFLMFTSTLACAIQAKDFQHIPADKYKPATVWFEDGNWYVYFGNNLMQIDSWSYVTDEYLDKGID